jgi:hypothetical protein
VAEFPSMFNFTQKSRPIGLDAGFEPATPARG